MLYLHLHYYLYMPIFLIVDAEDQVSWIWKENSLDFILVLNHLTFVVFSKLIDVLYISLMIGAVVEISALDIR